MRPHQRVGWRAAAADLPLGPVVPMAAALGGLALVLHVALGRYLAYRSPAYDLGFFDQVVERTAQGHPFQSSLLGYSFLGQHWEPVLALLAPLDRITATPIWLLVAQALALAMAPIAAWRLARAWLGVSVAAPLAALACVADPLIGRAAAFDFHSEALTPVLALLALDAAARGHRWRFWLPALGLLAVKEDAILVGLGVGLIAWRVDGRRQGLALCGVMLAGFVAVVGALMPMLRGGAPGDLASRSYGYLGGLTPGALLRGALLHPERWLRHLGSAPALRGLSVALAPLGGLPLLGGWAALAAAPMLLLALISADPDQAALAYHYGLEAFPLLLAAALLGWRRLRTLLGSTSAAPVADDHRRRRRLLGVAPALLGGAVLAGALAASPLLPGRVALDGGVRRPGVEALLARIPADAPVSASTGLVAHLASRAQLSEFPDRADSTRFVVLDDTGPRSSWSLADGYDAAVAALPARGYHIVARAQGVTLWAR